MSSDLDLLQQYAEQNSEEAFALLVDRHLNLVYSAAWRQVRSRELAEEVAQSVFADLARNISKLKPNTILSAWLYQVTRVSAIDVVRRESRRQLREQIALELTDMNSNSPEWPRIEPLLDEAMETLDATDRSAILLRYFENKSLREVGESLGASEDAAQKRISRAVQRLRDFFSKRKIHIGASGLTAALSANAVQSAPAGLGAMILAGGALSGTAIHQATAIGITKSFAMTTIQKTLLTTTLALAIGTGLYEAHQASRSQSKLAELLRERAPSTEEMRRLQRQYEGATAGLGALQKENEQLRREAAEIHRLRDEITRLKSGSHQSGKSGETGEDEDPVKLAMKSWLDRVDKLKQRFEEKPNNRIPEFQLLDHEDWLGAARTELNTDEDYRRAMSGLRGSAENKFAGQAFEALQKYREANNKQFPTDLAQLQEYFKAPMDEAILQRYAILPASDIPNLGMGGDKIISQLAPVDAEYDSRYGIGPNGYGSSGSGFKLDAPAEAIEKALAPTLGAFKEANNGNTPTEIAELAPFLKTPEEKAAYQKALEIKKSLWK